MSSAHEATGLLQSVVIALQGRLRRPDLYFGFNEAQLTAIIPVSSYWLTATFYELLEYFDILAQYRLQPTEEERRRNVPSRAHVIKTVLTLHAYQLLLGFAVDWLEIGEAGDETAARWAKHILSYYPPHHPSIESWHASILLQRIIPIVIYGAFLLGRQILALAVIDTWVFWFHFTAHKVQWIYRNIHSIHHELYTPYAYGALYNSIIESFFSDILSCVLAQTIVGLSNREAIFLFTFATMKQVDDHSGYSLPWSPFAIYGRLTGAHGVYHGIHHQKWGMKSNMENYFTFWDRLMATKYLGTRTLHSPPSQAEVDSWPSQRKAEYLAQLKEQKSQ
ncbi:hypothetical protein PENSTE_c012G00757 [Penicillium steckii]|uniref:Fatty acid hydroxylase domain-containing protein n=1 Tax=Penicillium steckii TaxID=303698 RepID=A0A1V6T5L4_9EURO|nr:hypothetical protein PENSTE_c012G00757 [Penicillium steckii]